ncbi:hypothetical protein O5623_06040 [Escherichia coli]|nr:hypothetical protein [Escherichia coli]MCZ6201095.1 hypothetical protein [Escherichia coli]
MKDDGRLAAAGNLTVSTTGELAAHGQVLSGGDMQLKGQGAGFRQQPDTGTTY